MKMRRMKPSQVLPENKQLDGRTFLTGAAWNKIRLKSPQFSFTLGPPKFVRAQICVGDMRVSRLQVKGRQDHLSQNISPAIAGSAGPVPPRPCYC